MCSTVNVKVKVENVLRTWAMGLFEHYVGNSTV